MSNYWSESFYRATIRQSIDSTQTVPFTLKVSKIPTLTTWLLTLSPNTANEELIEYNGVDGTALTITVVKMGISPSTQALTVDGTDYNNVTYKKSHSQNDSIRGDVNHLHIIQDYGNLQTQINAKVNTAAWTRTWLTANAIMRTNGSGVESADAIGSITPISTDTVLMQRAWDIVETPFSNFTILSQQSNSATEIAGEALVLWDAVCIEEQISFAPVLWEINGRGAYIKATEAKIWDVTGNTKRSQRIIGNWTSITTMLLWLRKNGAPADNVTVRIETDDGTGKPTGTLTHANATATVAWAWLSAAALWLASTTVTFAGAFTLTDKTPYHVVVWRSSGIDASNYYFLAHYTSTSYFFTTSLHNGTVWWTPATTVMMCMTLVWAYSKVLVKTRANDATKIFYKWFSLWAYALYSSAVIQTTWTLQWLSSLSKDSTYYLSNTAWAISTTAGTNVIEVWTSDNTGTSLIINDGKGNELYSVNSVIYTNWWASGFNLSFKSTKKASYLWTTSWGTGVTYNYTMKNGVTTGVSGTGFTLLPWDLYQFWADATTIYPTVTLYEQIGLNKQVNF